MVKEKQEEVRNFRKDNFIFLNMLAKSHMCLALLGSSALNYMPFEIDGIYIQLFVFFIIIGSVFPDIDEPRSFIGRKLPVISHLASISFSHRGFTHFFICPFLIFLFALFLIPKYELIAFCLFAFSFGILMHQIGDMLTISGIPYYFFPFLKIKAVLLPQTLRFKTGGLVEKTILYSVFLPLIVFLGMDKFNLLDSFNFGKLLNLIGGLL